MKDEAYVKEILQKFGETIDCYAKELKTKKYARMYGMLTDYNKNDPGFKNVVTQMQNVHSCFESEEIAKMSAGCISNFPTTKEPRMHTVPRKERNIHVWDVPNSLEKPPTLLDGEIIYGLDKDSKPIERDAVKTIDFTLINDVPVGLRKIGGRGVEFEID